MRRRSTFIPSPGVDYDPSELNIEGQSLTFANLDAAREERLTIGLHELPPEIVEVLQNSHELHIRWVTEKPYNKSAPYVSSLTPGLHVHYTPLEQSNEQLCPLLHTLFSPSLKCSTVEASFSRPHLISERFASAASLQYYSLLPSLNNFVAYIQRNVCPSTDTVCRHNAALLDIATYVDFDYDSISHALTLTAFWSQPPSALNDPLGEQKTHDHWNLSFTASPNDKTEVGILTATPGRDPHKIQMEGFLINVGEDNSPKPTMFFIPSRHHTLPPTQAKHQKYTISFEQPTGLHPKLRITFPSAMYLNEPTTKPQDSQCALHAYLTLPSALFIDEYALPTPDNSDPLFTAAHNILALRSLSGERDLEAPDYILTKWGSAVLIELATPPPPSTSASASQSQWTITIPLHTRYLPPNLSGYETITIPHPILFWSCPSDAGTKFTTNPFDRVNLGYDGLFGSRTMFYHLDSAYTSASNISYGSNGTLAGEGMLVEELRVPVLSTAYFGHGVIELVTSVVVGVGFLWVVWKIWGVMWADNNTVRERGKGKKVQ